MELSARVAFIQSQCVCAMAEIEGMKAENMQRQVLGQSMAYTDADFVKVISSYYIGHNDVISYLRD